MQTLIDYQLTYIKCIWLYYYIYTASVAALIGLLERGSRREDNRRDNPTDTQWRHLGKVTMFIETAHYLHNRIAQVLPPGADVIIVNASSNFEARLFCAPTCFTLFIFACPAFPFPILCILRLCPLQVDIHHDIIYTPATMPTIASSQFHSLSSICGLCKCCVQNDLRKLRFVIDTQDVLLDTGLFYWEISVYNRDLIL
jgi:hypothetical protein